MEALIERVKLRFSPDEITPDDGVIEEMLNTVSDRVKIRIEADEIPELGNSIVVEATMKALRLMGTEGSRSESAADGGSFSVSFIDDVLDAYKDDLTYLWRSIHSSGVQFL